MSRHPPCDQNASWGILGGMANPQTWSKALAAEMWQKSARVRAERKAERQALQAAHTRSFITIAPARERQTWVEDQLQRTRVLIEKISAMLLQSTEAREIRELASAFGTLADHERELAGRPKAGQLRPEGPGKALDQAGLPALQPIIEIDQAAAPVQQPSDLPDISKDPQAS